MARITLADEIGKRILRDFNPGSALPSERELAERYRCNRLTLRRALQGLNSSGLMTSISRNGHYLSKPDSPTPANKVSPISRKHRPHILLLSSASRMSIPEYAYSIMRFIHHAALLNVTLTIKELTQNTDWNSFKSHNCFHPGMEVDAYAICGEIPFRLYELLAKSMRPCIMVGVFEEQLLDKNYDLRCMQLLLSLEEPYAEAGRRLASFGHRKIMMASVFSDKETERIRHTLERQFIAAGLSDVIIDFQMVKGASGLSPNENARRAAREIADRLTDHTALIIIEGNVFGQELLRILLTERRLKCPEDISTIAQGCEIDWGQDQYDVDRIYFERGELGNMCIKEIIRQIDSGKLEYGVRYVPGSYLSRNSVGSPKEN